MRLSAERQKMGSSVRVRAAGRARPRKAHIEATAHKKPSPDSSEVSNTSEGQGLVVLTPTKAPRLVTKSSYRKPKASELELRERQKREHEEEEQRQHFLNSQDLRAEPSAPLQPPIMLIDAYNIMNIDLSSFMLSSDSWEFARGELERRVFLYAEAAGVYCIIVYDALSRYKQKGSQIREARINRRVSRMFTTGEEADSYIVRRALSLKAEGHKKVEIVSNDRRILMECDDLHDFVIYSVEAGQFVKDLHDCARGQVAAVRSRNTGVSALNNVKYFEQNLAASRSAAVDQNERLKLPEVAVTEVSQKLEYEMARIQVEGSMSSVEEEEDDHSPRDSSLLRALPMESSVPDKFDKGAGEVSVRKDSNDPAAEALVKSEEDISSILNDLFGNSKPSRSSLNSITGLRRGRRSF